MLLHDSSGIGIGDFVGRQGENSDVRFVCPLIFRVSSDRKCG